MVVDREAVMKKLILDPPIPYADVIRGGTFTPRKMIRIHGAVPSAAYRFNINLQCGSEVTPYSGVAIQVLVHMLQNYISFNSMQNGKWDEAQLGLAFPFRRAEKFEVIIMCDFNQYKVAINGYHYCDFPQRVHYDVVTHLAIDGDVSIILISYESDSNTPRPRPNLEPEPSNPFASAGFLQPTSNDDQEEHHDSSLPIMGPNVSSHLPKMPSYFPSGAPAIPVLPSHALLVSPNMKPVKEYNKRLIVVICTPILLFIIVTINGMLRSKS